MSIDAGRVHHTEVTPPERDCHDAPEGQGDPIVLGLRRRLRELDEQLAVERRKHELALAAAELKAERLRAWLVVIRWTCRGAAPGLAQQAIYSTEWPIGRAMPSEVTKATAPGKDQDHGSDAG